MVAAAVASGRADCGLGIAAAADAIQMDFVPLFEERYDLIVPKEYYESDLLAPLCQILEDEGFRKAVMSLPGYTLEEAGKLLA